MESLFCFGKLMELLARTFDQHKLGNTVSRTDNSLSTEMKKLMAEAKRIVENSLTDPPSLSQLSAEL